MNISTHDVAAGDLVLCLGGPEPLVAGQVYMIKSYSKDPMRAEFVRTEDGRYEAGVRVMEVEGLFLHDWFEEQV